VILKYFQKIFGQIFFWHWATWPQSSGPDWPFSFATGQGQVALWDRWPGPLGQGQLAPFHLLPANEDNDNHTDDCDNEANDEPGEGGRLTFPDMAAANIYHQMFKNVL
jgi:hypothetical protein